MSKSRARISTTSGGFGVVSLIPFFCLVVDTNQEHTVTAALFVFAFVSFAVAKRVYNIV